MSFIGTLEQFSLASILQRIEAYTKTGLLTIKQGVQWVEFYFRDGRLICIGPVRATPALGDRLVQDGVISAQALQDTLRSLGTTQPSETRVALALMDLGHASRDDLRAWASQRATEVLQIVLQWPDGEVHFEEEKAPPPDRLLVGLLATTLLAAAPATTAPSAPGSRPAVEQPPTVTAALAPDIARITTLMGAEQFLRASSAPAPSTADAAPATPFAPAASAQAPEPAAATPPAPSPASLRASSLIALSPSTSLPATEALPSPLPSPQESFPASPSFVTLPATESLPSLFDGIGEDDMASQPLAQPVPVMNPVPPRRIDTSFMRPEMVLLPANLTALRAHNPAVQITPQQWQVLARVDGRTSLLAASRSLGVPPELFCQVAGELIASGLIQVALPGQLPLDNAAPAPAAMTSGFNHGYMTPGYAAAPASPWSPALPNSDVLPPTPMPSFAGQAQWDGRAASMPGSVPVARASRGKAYAQAGSAR